MSSYIRLDLRTRPIEYNTSVLAFASGDLSVSLGGWTAITLGLLRAELDRAVLPWNSTTISARSRDEVEDACAAAIHKALTPAAVMVLIIQLSNIRLSGFHDGEEAMRQQFRDLLHI